MLMKEIRTTENVAQGRELGEGGGGAVLDLTPILFAKLDLSCGRCAYLIRKFYFIKISLL